ncbi:HTH APSES-type domain-containing protein [Mucor velutinosus]|uniref:HTH APSES-type domain-containing protein n=1 Tax=Mucor velutinosus TaxID=708070 RepID=A0AAN7HNJ3_9FUNG|nr:HTH APSES-type domain-containing protein [Mucor velutinosus]
MPTVSYILQRALLPIYSKLSDLYGRAQCYTFALVFCIISNVVLATANNYNTLVCGQVIYAFVYTGANILSPVTIADLTNAVDNFTTLQVSSISLSLLAWAVLFSMLDIDVSLMG